MELLEKYLTTKLKVVFHGSSRTNTGYFLNNVFHTGAILQIDLLEILI